MKKICRLFRNQRTVASFCKRKKEHNELVECLYNELLNEIKGDLQQSYTSPVVWEEGTFCISTKGDWLHHNDMFLAVLFGDMKRSSPIFDFEVIGNIHENSEMVKGGSNEA